MTTGAPTARATGGLRVEPVRGRRDLREFCSPPAWDPRQATHGVPLWHDAIRRWHTGRGPHVEHGSVRLYLARDAQGRVRGRTTLHTDSRMDARRGEPTLLLGATEFADRDALASLVAHAEERARSLGRTRLLGPVSLLPNQVGGVVTTGHHVPGFVDGPWSPEHYPQDWEALGFARIWTGATWLCDHLDRLDADALFGAGEPGSGVEVHRGSRRRLDEQLPLLRSMLNAAFAEFGYYTPITAEELAVQTDGLAWLLDERLLLWATADGSPSAFVLVVPDLSDFVRSTGGRLGLTDQLRLLATRARYRREAVLIIKGTVPGARGLGLMRLLSGELLRGLQAGGYQRLRVTFIGDDNAASGLSSRRWAGGRCTARPSTTRGSMAERPTQQVLERAADWGRSPSAHNTQPWDVHAVDATTLAVDWHADRALPVADPDRRDLMLSLGAVILGLRVVAADVGLTARTTWGVDLDARRAARLHLEHPTPEVDAPRALDSGGLARPPQRAGSVCRATGRRRRGGGRHAGRAGPRGCLARGRGRQCRAAPPRSRHGRHAHRPGRRRARRMAAAAAPTPSA